MESYKLILGLRPDLSADKQKKVLGKIKDLISEAGGKMGEVKSKGLTKLAYPIADFERSEKQGAKRRHITEANFTNIFFEIPDHEPKAHQPLAGNIKSLQKELGLIKEVLRMMVIREEVKTA